MCTLGVCVVFSGTGEDQAAFLPSVNVPAAPGGFVGRLVGGRSQTPVNNFSVDIDFYFPIFNASEPFFRVANGFQILAAEGLDFSGFSGQQNDGDEGRGQFVAGIFGSSGELRLVDSESDLLRCTDDAGWGPAVIGGRYGKTIFDIRRWHNRDQEPRPACIHDGLRIE